MPSVDQEFRTGGLPPTAHPGRQMKDSKKNEWQLQAEVADLKKQRNKDAMYLKILKVELKKLELLFKKYKESTNVESQTQI